MSSINISNIINKNAGTATDRDAASANAGRATKRTAPGRNHTQSVKSIERRALAIGIVINVIMVAAGFAVYFMTGLKSMFLDAAFTAISVASGLVAVYLSRRTVRTTERFPNGMFALEPMYALCKAMFTLSLLVFAVLDSAQVAWEWLAHGEGEPAQFGPVVIYGIACAAMCLGLVAYYRRRNRAINDASTMLAAESNATFIDGAISFGIGVAAVLLTLLPMGTPLDFLHFTGDFLITAAIVALTIKEPVAVLRDAFVELVGGVHEDEEINDFVEAAAQRHLPEGTEYEKTLIFKTGMNFTVDVYLAGTGETIDVHDLIDCKRSLERALKKRLHLVDVDFVFD